MPKKPQAPKPTDASDVEDYMQRLDHPLKAEIEALRRIIKKSNRKINERIKWNAPSYFYVEDLAAFNLRSQEYIQIVFVFPRGLVPDPSGMLQGEWKDRRIARFNNMKEVRANKAALESVVNAWVALIDSDASNAAQESVDEWPRGLSNPALRALENSGYKSIQDLAKVRAAEIAKLHGMGPKGVRILREALAEKGLAFLE